MGKRVADMTPEEYARKHKSDAAWRQANPDRVLVNQRNWRAKNRDKVNARMAKWAAANRDKINARVAKWRAANRDKVNACVAKYAAANRDKINARMAKWAAANRDKVNATSRAWQDKNPTKKTEYNINRKIKYANDPTIGVSSAQRRKDAEVIKKFFKELEGDSPGSIVPHDAPPRVFLKAFRKLTEGQ